VPDITALEPVIKLFRCLEGMFVVGSNGAPLCSGLPGSSLAQSPSTTDSPTHLPTTFSDFTVTLTPNIATEATTLTCTVSAPSPPPDVTFSYKWQVDGDLVSGATINTLTGASFDRGNQVNCQAAASVGGGPLSNYVTSQSIGIRNTAPTITGCTVTVSDVGNGDFSYECTPLGASDVNFDAISYS